MGKLIINNTTCPAACPLTTDDKNSTLPRGDGVRTEDYKDEILQLICAIIEELLQQKYQCHKDQLQNESDREGDEEGDIPDSGGTPTSPGTPFGAGVIGDGRNNDIGNAPGYIPNTNIYVGIPDPDVITPIENIYRIIEANKADIQKERKC